MFVLVQRFLGRVSGAVSLGNGSRPSSWFWLRKPWVKRVFSWLRMLHIYLSCLAFSLLLFFCVSGLFLNHLDWFEPVAKSGTLEFSLPSAADGGHYDSVLWLTEQVGKATGLGNPREVNIDLEMGECTLDYPLPAGYAFVTVFPETGVMEVVYQKGTMIAILNDLHKGRHSGGVWSWVIDVSAVLIGIVSLTGLFLLFQLVKRRTSGLILVLLGTLLPVVIFYLWVPSFS